MSEVTRIESIKKMKIDVAVMTKAVSSYDDVLYALKLYRADSKVLEDRRNITCIDEIIENADVFLEELKGKAERDLLLYFEIVRELELKGYLKEKLEENENE